MYKCAHCRRQMAANTPSKLFTTQTRPKIYPERFINHKHARGKKDRYLDLKHFDEGGQGFEIVREIRVCPPCHQSLVKEKEQA